MWTPQVGAGPAANLGGMLADFGYGADFTRFAVTAMLILAVTAAAVGGGAVRCWRATGRFQAARRLAAAVLVGVALLPSAGVLLLGRGLYRGDFRPFAKERCAARQRCELAVDHWAERVVANPAYDWKPFTEDHVMANRNVGPSGRREYVDLCIQADLEG